jgi:MFS family permease
LLLYFLAVQGAAQIAGPYFTPYMLGPMHLSYAAYVMLIGISFAAKAISLPALGRFAHRFGARRLLWFGGLGIVPVSGLWLISNSFAFLVFVQVIAGATWAAYELAVLLLCFETIRADERTSVLTSFNLAHAAATASGSLLGGALLALGGKTPQAYLCLFALSSLARGLTVVALMRLRKMPDAVATAETPHIVPGGFSPQTVGSRPIADQAKAA